jgi:hypothetical protein
MNEPNDLLTTAEVALILRAPVSTVRYWRYATTTLRTYAHLWPTAEDRTRTAAADLMRSATSPENSADFLRTRTRK